MAGSDAGRALACALLWVVPCACEGVGARAWAGALSSELRGDVALGSSTGTDNPSVDVADDLGLTDASTSVWAKVAVEPGLGTVTASAFRYDQSGTGTLSSDFGDITAGATVRTDLRLDNLKASWTFDVLDSDVVHLAPGLALDYFAIDTTVSATMPVTGSERLEVQAPVPLLYLQGMLDLGFAGVEVEGGWMSIDLGDADGTFADFEAMLRVPILSSFELVGGYRYVLIDADGSADGQRFAADLDLQGFYLGGGLSF